MSEITFNVTIKAILLFFAKAIGLFCLLYFTFNTLGAEKKIINTFLNPQTVLHTRGGQTAMFMPNEESKDLDCKLIVYQPSIQPNGKFLYFNMKYLFNNSLIFMSNFMLIGSFSYCLSSLLFKIHPLECLTFFDYYNYSLLLFHNWMYLMN